MFGQPRFLECYDKSAVERAGSATLVVACAEDKTNVVVRTQMKVQSAIVCTTTLGTNAFHRRPLGERSAVLQWALWGNGGTISQLEITTMREVAPKMEAGCRRGTG